MKLYHYTSLASFKFIWEGKKLKFSESKGMNDFFERHSFTDPVESRLPYNGENSEVEVIENNVSAILCKINEYKQISLCMDYPEGLKGYASPMMWGQYERSKDEKGNWQDGACIEIDLDAPALEALNLLYSKITYTDQLSIQKLEGWDFTEKDAINKYIESNKELLFFTKHRHWEHENEFRIISNNMDYLDISNAITGVYVLGQGSFAMKEVEGITKTPSLIHTLICTGGDKSPLTLSCFKLESCRNIERRNKERKR